VDAERGQVQAISLSFKIAFKTHHELHQDFIRITDDEWPLRVN
jgi:hypothetical protein